MCDGSLLLGVDCHTAGICFVQKRWLTGLTITLVVTYSETDGAKFEDASV